MIGFLSAPFAFTDALARAQGHGVYTLHLGSGHIEMGKRILTQQERTGSANDGRNIIQFEIATHDRDFGNVTGIPVFA